MILKITRDNLRKLIHLFKLHTTNTDLVMRYGIWPQKVSIFTNFAIPSEKYCLSIKSAKYTKSFKIRTTSCYDLNFTCI